MKLLLVKSKFVWNRLEWSLPATVFESEILSLWNSITQFLFFTISFRLEINCDRVKMLSNRCGTTDVVLFHELNVSKCERVLNFHFIEKYCVY